MTMCDGPYEIQYFEELEMLHDDEIPEDLIDDKLSEWDENTHLGDYPGETEINNHYSEEYCELRSIGLTHPEIMKVIHDEL